MAANTGRTTSKWCTFKVDDSSGTLREIAVNSINGVGLDYDMVDLTAFTDAIHGALPAHPSCKIDIAGPFDTTASTGSHVVLSGIAGLLPATYLSLGVWIGIRHAWDAEPVFGLTGTAANGFICTSYKADVNNGTYTASFEFAPGSAAPAWGVANIT